MKHFRLAGIGVLCCLCSLLWVSTAFAGWEDYFDALAPDGEIQDDQLTKGTLYGAKFRYLITSPTDGRKGNLSKTDLITEFTVESIYTGKQLSFPGGNRDELRAWADAHADELFEIMYSSAPDQAIGGAPNSYLLTSQNVDRLFFNVQTVRRQDIGFTPQYDFLEIGPEHNDASGYSGTLSYASVIGETGEHAVGFEIPFRSLEVDDHVNSSMTFAMLKPFYEYSTTSGPNRFSAMADVLFGVTYTDSDIFNKGAGFLQYGASCGGGWGRTLTPWLTGRAGLVYQYLKGHLPGSSVKKDFRWIAEAINDAPAEQTLTPAVGVTFQILPETLNLDVNAMRVHLVGGDLPDESKYQTIASTYLNYTTGHWKLHLGYKTSFELEDYKAHSVIAGVRYLW
jgi:hypothetical protein